MSDAEAIAYGSILMGAMSLILVLGFAYWLITVISHWRLFTKAGEKGWKSLIPVYTDYTLFKLVWNTKGFWIWFGSGVVTAAVSMLTTQYVMVEGQLTSVATGNIVTTAISFVASIVSLIWSAMMCLRMAIAYGKKPSFGIGLFLLPFIFKPILAFGSGEYQGPQA
ncbi:MAG: DUF5684 domain-containing protein [Coriobacteriales bacterium]|nr:DUF5684 domain-containing protein [Coriobacteriales bacterium]